MEAGVPEEMTSERGLGLEAPEAPRGKRDEGGEAIPEDQERGAYLVTETRP